jgi:hypothetical protein
MVVATDISKQPQIDAAVTEVVNELSPSVRKIRFEIGEDWSGELAVFFRVLLSDSASEPENLRAIAPRVVSAMSQRLDLPVLGLFPYFNFRSETEQSLAKEPAWA